MASLVDEVNFGIAATSVIVTDHHLTVDLEDGRTISVPTSWYPRLEHGTAAERANVEIGPFGLHWPDLEEDVSIKALLLGNRSGESRRSLQEWLEFRARGERVPVPTYSIPEDLAKELPGTGS